MAGQENLYGAIVTACRADATLVSLTGHTTSEHRIGRKAPPVKGRMPFLGIHIAQSVPLMGSDCTRLQIARVEFTVSSQNELTTLQIISKIEELLNPETIANISFWDFSDTHITTKMSRFKNRLGLVFDEKTESWSSTIVADVIWINETC